MYHCIFLKVGPVIIYQKIQFRIQEIKFEDIKQIGVGGFAKVYSATWIDGKAKYYRQKVKYPYETAVFTIGVSYWLINYYQLRPQISMHIIVSKIPNPKLLPKSQIIAEIPNYCQNLKPFPKSKPLPKFQNIAEIPNHCQNQNHCQNPKLKFQTEPKFFFQFSSVLIYDYTFGIWQRFWDLAIICDFDKGLGFRQQFGISAIVWDFGNSLGFGIWDFGKIPKLYFSICQIPNMFRHL
ncbi:hypothetical protein RhiirA1_439552 [Rhizophagus irregularis]|uniref:Protein kinase domain-containing protein n=1 Tax=Rhizophagus irregularis TaxID=588596 RepID=A0A2N0S3U5_9GLOM|nr:hypothetical protein RhiirA1_439552 [Rhizophagus irregularis]